MNVNSDEVTPSSDDDETENVKRSPWIRRRSYRHPVGRWRGRRVGWPRRRHLGWRGRRGWWWRRRRCFGKSISKPSSGVLYIYGAYATLADK